MHVEYVERHGCTWQRNLKSVGNLLNNAHLLVRVYLCTYIDGVCRFITLEYMDRTLPLRILFFGNFNRPFGNAYRTSTAYHGFI